MGVYRFLDKQRKENVSKVKALLSYENKLNLFEDIAKDGLYMSIIASKNIMNIFKIKNKDLMKTIFSSMLLLFLLFLFRNITWLFIIFLILTFFCLENTFEFFKYEIFNHLKIAKAIKKTECYKGILNKLQSYNINEIKYISVNRIGVKVIDKNDVSNDIVYQNYNFPELSFYKQGILLGSLLYDLHCNKTMVLSVPHSCFLENTNLCVRGVVTNPKDFKTDENYNAFFLAENKKMILALEKEKSKIQKENKIILEKNMKDGKTW